MFRFALLFVVCSLLGVLVNGQFQVPDVLVEALTPKGFRVSIPDEEGISLFAFHGKINEEVFNREAGTFSVDITKARDGRWTYRDNTARLKIGDKIHYWVNVDFDDGSGKRGYIKDDQVFVVNELVSANGSTPIVTDPPVVTPKPTTENSGCLPTPTRANGRSSCQGKLIFQDNFPELLPRKWRTEIKFAGDPDYEFVIYNNYRENLYIDRNKLFIKPTLTEVRYGTGFVFSKEGLNLGKNCTGVPESFECYQKATAWLILPPVISAQITTRNLFSFTYGVVEVRARLPRGDWVYPEIYLQPKNEDYGAGLESGLIKIAFTPGNRDLSKHLSSGCILGSSISARNYGVKTVELEKKWTDDFHVFRIEWKTDKITLMVDGNVYGNIFPPDDGFASLQNELELEEATVNRWKQGTKLAPFDKEMFITLGVGVGGQSFIDTIDDIKPWSNDDPKAQLSFYRAQSTWSQTWTDDNSLIVDYVKVWAL